MAKEHNVLIVPVLDGWITAKQAAEEVLGISRQSVTRMMNEGVFQTIHAVGDRPLYVVHQSEVERFAALFEQTKSWSAAAKELAKEKFEV